MVIPIWLPTHTASERTQLKSLNPSFTPDRDAEPGEMFTLLNEGKEPGIVTDVKGGYYYVQPPKLTPIDEVDRRWHDGNDNERKLPGEHPSQWYKSCVFRDDESDERPVAPPEGERKVPTAKNFKPTDEKPDVTFAY
ncbi:unnamed protein product [Vitrella brassicaformis CCMP3155]|uniref:Uncharacterized protein n=2 Tax=Vitrella brassicaformis TaxID=1169539 RepID=A0A0G4EZ53_VITBC|nr:unnamed protein product [Vitrella brassicaformis CCMP3155]|eukprot:CEM04592.1 unnamed protein product [Vitrella brassicaformis CCMP3155]